MPEPQPLPTILAVDDSVIAQDIVRQSLGDRYRVLVASNATDALAIVYHQPIAALVLDLVMPEVDGLELCRTLRSLEQFQNLPIIMLTACDRAFDKMQGRMAGATDYLTKPFDPDHLKRVIDQYVPSAV